MKIEKIKNFLNQGRDLSKDSVMYMMLGAVALGLIGIALSYDLKMSASIILPFMAVLLIVYVTFIIKKNPQKKYINLYFGIHGIIASIICQCCCIMSISISTTNILIIIISLLLSNIFVIILVTVCTIKMVNSTKEIRPTSYISYGLITACALSGTLIAEHISEEYKEILLCISYAILSLIFSVFFVFILKYYYFNIIAKFNDENKSNY